MKCVIIEDELPAQRVLHNYISKLSDIDLVGSFQSALEANSLLKSGQIDVLFLDINLPDISGIQYIKTLLNPPKIIMTTAYHEHAVESFELDTICDYLVKPFSFERFLKAINKIKVGTNIQQLEKEETNTRTIFLNIDKTLHKVFLNDILFIESDRNYITIISKNGKWSYIDSLKNWLEKIPDHNFIQIHKSYIINFNWVYKISGNMVYIEDKKLPIGRLYKDNLIKKLSLK
tara:strand:+ start:180115 stop:180810 length:696 start_codon:yes stop_codon:yes gene_type:complete